MCAYAFLFVLTENSLNDVKKLLVRGIRPFELINWNCYCYKRTVLRCAIGIKIIFKINWMKRMLDSTYIYKTKKKKHEKPKEIHCQSSHQIPPKRKEILTVFKQALIGYPISIYKSWREKKHTKCGWKKDREKKRISNHNIIGLIASQIESTEFTILYIKWLRARSCLCTNWLLLWNTKTTFCWFWNSVPLHFVEKFLENFKASLIYFFSCLFFFTFIDIYDCVSVFLFAMGKENPNPTCFI